MNEQELRDAMRAAVQVAPPPMSETPVLDAARSALRRRRNTWWGVASAAVAVAVMATGVYLVRGEPDPPGLRIADSDGATMTTTMTTTTTNDTVTTESWPSGQVDRTAYSGPHFDQALALVDKLIANLPPGLSAPDNLAGLRVHEGQYVDPAPDGTEIWEYRANVPVARNGGVGELSVVVLTASLIDGDGCLQIPNPAGTCEELPVDGKVVAVLRAGLDSVPTAVYRHAAGQVVTINQSTGFTGSGMPPLDKEPLSVDELAAMVVDETFLPS